MRLTTEQLDALEAALKAATEGEITLVPNAGIDDDPDERYWAIEAGQGYYDGPKTGFRLTGFISAADSNLIVLAHNALPALIAEVRRLREAVRWRLLSEAHEDHGPVILMDLRDPGFQMISHVCAETWPDDIEGMTHFAKLPPLTNEEAEEMLAALPMPPAPEATDA